MKGIHFLAFLTATLIGSATMAAVIDDYAAITNDRFANSTSFIGSEYDWSGVGMTPGGRFATLIGENTVISSYHLRPSGRIMFYPDNDATNPAVSSQIADMQQLGETDFFVGCLVDPVPSTIHHYDIATENITSGNFADSLVSGSQVFIAGRSPGLYANQVDQAIGQNVISGYSENSNASLGENVDSLRMVYDLPGTIDDPGNAYTNFETHAEVGDSGAPVFAVVDGQLVVVGVNSFVSTDTQGNVTSTHASYVGNESDAAHGFIGSCIASVPEPSSGGMFMCMTLLAFACRRRN